jgi:hypothetical protein
MPTKSYFLLYFLQTYKCKRMNHMNCIYKLDDIKEMFHSKVYVIHLEVFFLNCLHYNRNAFICMVKYIFLHIYFCIAQDYTTMMSFSFSSFQIVKLKIMLGTIGINPHSHDQGKCAPSIAVLVETCKFIIM